MKNHLGSANTTFLRFKANIFLVLVAVCFTLNACTENPKMKTKLWEPPRQTAFLETCSRATPLRQ